MMMMSSMTVIMKIITSFNRFYISTSQPPLKIEKDLVFQYAFLYVCMTLYACVYDFDVF